MSGLFKNLFLLSLCLVVISCGKNEDTSHKVPESTNPDQSAAPSTPAPVVPTTTPDPRIPDFTGSVPLDLTDKNFDGLSDLAGRSVLLPMVGDPKLVLHLKTGSNFSVSGDMLVGFEDKLGLEAIRVPTLAGAATTRANGQSNQLDTIFASSEIIFRVVGNLISGTGNIYYRLRTSADPTITYNFADPYTGQAKTTSAQPYCSEVTIYCVDQFGNKVTCPKKTVIDVASPCQNTFMQITNASVKKLGSFNVQFSNWISLEGK